MSHHVLRDRHLDIVLAIMDLELEADEIRQDGCGASLGADGKTSFAGLGARDG